MRCACSTISSWQRNSMALDVAGRSFPNPCTGNKPTSGEGHQLPARERVPASTSNRSRRGCSWDIAVIGQPVSRLLPPACRRAGTWQSRRRTWRRRHTRRWTP